MKTTIAIILIAFQLSTRAQLVTGITGGDPLSVGPGTAGFSFTVGTQLTLRTLGLWQDVPLSSSHLVGIWEMATPQHALLASALLTPQSAAQVGEFWYVNLSAPLTLLAGREYMIGARYSDNDFDFALGNVASVTTDPRITMGDAYLSTGVGFEFPELNVSGANFGFYGPNAGFALVPEPAGVLLATGLALGAFAFLRRRSALIAAAFALITVAPQAAEPPVTVRSILDAKPAERQRLFALIAKRHPSALVTLAPAVVPPANRPPVTPGNTHGKRPVVPPGLARNYATP